MDIGGYSITSEFTTAGGGRCQWAFARKGSTEYFLKCFLSPKQVIPGKTRGSPSTVAAQRARCTAFEIRHNKLLSALAGKSGAGGNLIAPIDFFSYDGKYYKVTEKVSTGVPPDRVSGLGHDSKLLVLRSAANSIRILHSAGIVHGDIKPDNIIVRDRGGGKTTSSIIDFDDSYFLGDPPMPPEELTFDPPSVSLSPVVKRLEIAMLIPANRCSSGALLSSPSFLPPGEAKQAWFPRCLTSLLITGPRWPRCWRNFLARGVMSATLRLRHRTRRPGVPRS
jgi:serine/threonine protein kinase